jgi:hypothetical protein
MGQMKQIFMEAQDDDYHHLTPYQKSVQEKRAKKVQFIYTLKQKEDANNCKKRK